MNGLTSLAAPGSSPKLALEQAIAAALPNSTIKVAAHNPGHFSISVVSQQFEGKTKLACQRLVYRAIASLMAGASPPVHAIDRMQTKAP